MRRLTSWKASAGNGSTLSRTLGSTPLVDPQVAAVVAPARSHSRRVPQLAVTVLGLGLALPACLALLTAAGGQNGSGRGTVVRSRVGTREYRLFVPSSAGEEPLPLVVALHGCWQTPDDFARG